jgi:hypothetical protein
MYLLGFPDGLRAMSAKAVFVYHDGLDNLMRKEEWSLGYYKSAKRGNSQELS